MNLVMSGMTRKKFIDLHFALSLIPESIDYEKTVVIDGLTVHVGFDNHITFKSKGLSCVGCGTTATHVAIEKRPTNTKPYCNWHLNFYHIEEEVETLFTKDHIYARSAGGPDALENYQTMFCGVTTASKRNLCRCF